MDFSPYLRPVLDYPAPGTRGWDFSPLMADADAFSKALDAMAAPVLTLEPTHILGLESRGFIFGSALARQLRLGFVPARRPGKLPPPVYREPIGDPPQDYLEISVEAFRPGARVLIVDDILATGDTASAARALIRRTGAQPLALTLFIEVAHLPGREKLAGLPVFSVLRV